MSDTAAAKSTIHQFFYSGRTESGGKHNGAPRVDLESHYDSVRVILTMAMLDRHLSDVPSEVEVGTGTDQTLILKRTEGVWHVVGTGHDMDSFTRWPSSRAKAEGRDWIEYTACQAIGVPIEAPFLDRIAEIVSWRPGSFEDNFGDQGQPSGNDHIRHPEPWAQSRRLHRLP